MRSWDIRCPQKDAKVESTFMKSGDHTATTCITHHPTQRHMVNNCLIYLLNNIIFYMYIFIYI